MRLRTSAIVVRGQTTKHSRKIRQSSDLVLTPGRTYWFRIRRKREAHQFRQALSLQFFHDACAVDFHGTCADRKAIGDGFVRVALDEPIKTSRSR